jgi:hypothetical protein
VEWRKFLEECCDLYCLPDITPVIKLKTLQWAGRVASIGKRRGGYRVLVWKPEGKGPHARAGVDGRIN